MLDRYGRVTLARIVAAFYADVLQSRTLGHYFAHVSITGLVQHQSMFMAAVMGGPAAFDSSHIRVVHEDLGITSEDFAEMLDMLEGRMLQGGIEPDDVRTVLDGYRQMRPEVVSVPGGD
jgi:hemoglobin